MRVRQTPLFLLLLILADTDLVARVTRVDVSERRDILAGRSFGRAGPYEVLRGTIFFEADPLNSANQMIADIQHAPRNKKGRIEYSADFFLIRPKDIGISNRVLLFEVSNRGRKSMLGFFNFAAASLNPELDKDFGDGFLLRQGYTLLWVGWQFDVPQQPQLIRLQAPIAQDRRPIRGLARSNFVVTRLTYDYSLADRNHIAYPVADPAAAENVLTVRNRVEDTPEVIPRSRWKFARMADQGVPVEDRSRVYLEGGFQPGRIYEVVYVVQDPPLVGLGPAVVRDAVSYLKHNGSDELGIGKGAIQHAIAFGISQSGRFLRTFLYHGFNGDENHRRVFDGVMAHVAGAGRGSFNHRFAQPSRDAHPFMNFLYPTDIFPFTDIEQTDTETGMTDGLLTHGLKPEFRPSIFYTNSSYEYWGRAASLIHITTDGQGDATLFDHVRIYHFAGSQHGPASFPPEKSIGQQRGSPMDFRWSMRALLGAMYRWVAEGVSPPPSRYPRIDQRTLVPPEKVNFPRLPGVNFSTRVHKAYRVDYGPRFRSEGIIDREPPKLGKPFPLLVPAVDADGNELSGIRLPELAAPLATYTGWNLFNAESGPTDEISSMVGSYIPFPRNHADRDAAKDPRLSIQERYQSRDHYLGLLTRAALPLVEEGYLLKEDLADILRNGLRHWDYLVVPR